MTCVQLERAVVGRGWKACAAMVALALCLAGIAAAQPPAFSLDDAMAAHATRALRSAMP